MEPSNSNMLERFYLNNCRKIFSKFLDINIGLRDVVLMGDDGTCIKCHRFVLSACSPFFDRAFDAFTKTKDSVDVGGTELVLLLATYKSKNVQRMVDFIYHGELSDDLCYASDKDIDDDFIRLAKELKISGLHEVLVEKRKRQENFNYEALEVIANDEKVIDLCVNDNYSDENGLETSEVEELEVIDASEESLKSLPGDNIELVKEPHELLKSLPEYNNWLRLLSNVRKRQMAKNQTLRDKNPQELLNDIIEGVKYCFLNYPNGEYECLSKIRGQCFFGKGSSQQAARLKCVKTILKNIFNISFDEPQASAISSAPLTSSNDTFGDLIESLILNKYHSLMINNVQYIGYKVIAGIVKSVDNDRTNLEVISIGTGSKFLYEKHLNSNGNAVHDTHAEVVARRGFIRYIYNQIGQYVHSNPSRSIFEKADDAKRKFRLKPGIRFHLYVSTAPCGDARVHSHTNGTESISSIIPEGQLRTKGQHALTVKKDAASLECNVNMSCSAKLLRWNILGMQGAVLSELIEPIYLTTMVFGEKFNPIHMKRALFGRIGTDFIVLPTGFRVSQPELMRVLVTKAKPATYSPNHSVNWNAKGFDVELLESTSGCTMGRDKTKRYSRISKRAMFSEYVRVAKKLHHPHEQKYVDAKDNAKDYQMTKSILFQIFENNGLGTWVQKRVRNLDDFTI